jgi:hypothetical protein
LDAPVRDGEILEVRGSNGEAPYLVRWSDTGRESLFFPGPDSHVHHYEPLQRTPTAQPEAKRPAQRRPEPAHLRNWHVDLYLFEDQESTTAHAVLHSASPNKLDSRGAAQRRPREANVPEVGDEVAVARALRGLADRLLAAASEDMSAIEGHAIQVES